MAVIRIGMDIVSVARVANAISCSSTFVHRVFSQAEREIASKMPLSRGQEFLAGRFAVKEAVLKAMRSGLEQAIDLRDIETVTAGDGAPELRLRASALELARSLGLEGWNVSISHESGIAAAFVVAER